MSWTKKSATFRKEVGNHRLIVAESGKRWRFRWYHLAHKAFKVCDGLAYNSAAKAMAACEAHLAEWRALEARRLAAYDRGHPE